MTALFLRVAYWILSPLHTLMHACGACSLLMAMPGFERVRWNMGRLGAWIRFQSMRRRVPAYREFLAAHLSTSPAGIHRLVDIPSIDKANYVSVHALASRCHGGMLPTRGLLIDESSGSSGVPTNWVRGKRERAANGRTIRFGLRHRLGKEPLFFINAFALGPWATGINLTLTMATWTRIKTLGPDRAKIINTLKLFGTSHHYVIMGYPPFLKQLLDSNDVDWASYRISLIFGGEGMGESMRRYLQSRGVQNIFGSYGASDLDLNLAAETTFTIAVRRLLESRPDIAEKLLQHHGALPMIFQYNPADFFVESTADGELLVTICRPHYVAPKVRYNIHDVGHVVRYPDLIKVLEAAGVNARDLDPHALDLPLMFHYGRSDLSVSYYGCKIPPADIQETLFRLPEMASGADAFQLRTWEDDDGDKRLAVSLEIAAGALAEGASHWSGRFFDTLAVVNQDFRESRRMVPAGKEPALEFHAIGTGPFANADIRIKRVYVSSSAQAPTGPRTGAR